jgi:glycosyltransferase involved in cell wall biosynthesis
MKECEEDWDKDELKWILFDGPVDADKGEVFVILFLTRIEKYKGIYETFEIFDRLTLRNLNIELHIAGDGSEMDTIKSLVCVKNNSKIKILGYLSGDEKINAYKNSSVYLFPSYSEGMPNSVLEAMACGLPIICTNVGALEDFFENEKMGFIHPMPINIESFENSILTLYYERELLNTMASFNNHYAKDHFLASRSIQKLEALIND